jgi:CSLREA domain-containing protein
MKKVVLLLILFAAMLIGVNSEIGEKSGSLSAATTSSVASPTNDDFVNATVLAADSGSLIGESNASATAQAGEPNHNGRTPTRSVWYQWTPAVDGNAVMQATTQPYSTWNIVLGVYTGSAVDALTEVAAGGAPLSVGLEAEFRVEAGVTYYLAIDGWTSLETGSFDLTWSIPSPANDDFANAAVLTADSGWLLGEANEWATAELGEPAHNGLAGTPARSVWYRWTAAANGAAVITGDTRRYPSSADIVMAAYTGAAVDTLTEVAAWGGFGINKVRLEFAVVAGTTYHIVLDGYDEDETSSFDLTWALSPPVNDDFADAIVLAEHSGTLVGETTKGATPQIGEPAHGAVPGTPIRSVWYEWRPTWDGDAAVDVNTPITPDDWDSVVAIYTGSSLDTLTEVAATSTVATNLHLEFSVTAGTTYRLVVDGHDGDNWGSFDLSWANDPHGDTFHVTKTEDTGDGACDADCSLREAVVAANETGGDDTIHLPAGVYTLTLPAGSLHVERESGTTTILGAGRGVTIIDAAGLASLPGGVYARSRVFGLDYHAGLKLVGITVTGGYTASGDKDGAGIYSLNGFLTLIDCLIEGNVSGENGGGIANLYGTAIISNTIIRNNNTDPSEYTTTGFGGGIYNSGTMTITDSLIENNESDWGGGIASQWWLLEDYVPSLTIIDSTISENTAEHGAGIANTESMPDEPGREAMLTISDSRIIDNHANRSQYGYGAYNEGGGVLNAGFSAATLIANSTISGNLVTAMHAPEPSDGSGGGLHNHGGRVEIRDSTISGNEATCDQMVHGDPDLCGRGGGILNTGAGRLVVLNSTISGNETALLNSDHGAYLGGGGGGGLAHMPSCGGSYCWCPATTIINTTIADNAADHGGGINTRWETWTGSRYDIPEWEVEPHSNIYECSGLSVLHAIVADNSATFTVGTEDCWGEYDSVAYNLVGESTGCPAGGEGDIIAADPLLAPLANNGGDTETHVPLAGSPAIDAGDPAGCTDNLGAPITAGQRGYPRPSDGDGNGNAICDIGSVEYLLIPIPLSDVTLDGPTSGDVGSTYSYTATATPISATLPISYSWLAAGQAPVVHTNGLTDTASFTWDAPGSYTVTIIASNVFSTVTDTLVIVIDEVPVSGLEADNDGPTPLGLPTYFTTTITAGSNVSYTWDFGDGKMGYGGTFSHTYAAAGSYTAVVTATNTVDQQSATTTVLVEESISGLAAINDGPTALGIPTHFTATVTAGSNVSYTWDLGDDQIGLGETPSHTYAVTGTYTATVTATNAVSEQVMVTRVEVYGFSNVIYTPLLMKP